MVQPQFRRDDVRRLSGEDQVLQALLHLGGAAHVDEIVGRVTIERRRRGLAGGPPVRTMVETALHHMRAVDDQVQAPCGGRVYRPFGPASRRWAVCHPAPAPAPSRRPILALVE